MKKKLAAILAALMLLGALTACGGDNDASGGNASGGNAYASYGSASNGNASDGNA